MTSEAYVITKMLNGGYRFECYKRNCGYWTDVRTQAAARVAQKNHAEHHARSA